MYDILSTALNSQLPSCGCQKHLHEVVGSVEVTGRCDPHGHRFATMSGEAVATSACDHVHLITFCTDYHDGHYHEFTGYCGGAIYVGCGQHIHFAEAETDGCGGHCHKFKVTAMISDPTGE